MKQFKFFRLYNILFFTLISSVVHAENRDISPSFNINKVIIPSAGLGTRCLPWTKSIPKEMLPIGNMPAFQFIAKEVLNSGVYNIIVIANDNKQAISHYFSHQANFENILYERGKEHLIVDVNKIIDALQFSYIPQPELLGTGHAILMAQDAIGYEYFCVMFPDEVFFTRPALGQLIAIAKKYRASVIAVREVPMEHVSRYGVITIQTELEENVFEISDIVEKPTIEKAPSNLATCGRYVFSPTMFTALKLIGPGYGGEIQYTDGVRKLIEMGERVIAVNLVGEQPHDIGNTLGWLGANITYAMQHPVYSSPIRELCAGLLTE